MHVGPHRHESQQSGRQPSKQNIEDIYPLSPMQEGMLFQNLYNHLSGIYLSQNSFILAGNLDLTALTRAWESILMRHSILRTAFIWEGLKKPVQIVYRHLQLPLKQLDWRGISPDEQDHRLKKYLQTDLEEGFDLAKPPLIRLTLIHLSNQLYHFVWTSHHIILDGWSRSLLIREIFAHYEATTHGREAQLPATQPYREYIAWLQRTRPDAERFWQTELAGFATPTRLAIDIGASDVTTTTTYNVRKIQKIELSLETTKNLNWLAHEHHLTLNVIIQGAWAILLSRYSGEDNVVFGITTAGRQPELEHIESMVGLFINTLPFRVHLDSQTTLISWLRHLQQHQTEILAHEGSSAVDIQHWSDIPHGQPLFDNLFIFYNYPMEQSGDRLYIDELEISPLSTHGIELSHLPLTVMANMAAQPEGDCLELHIAFDPHRFSSEAIYRLLDHLITLLKAMASGPELRLCNLPLLTEREQRQILVDWNATTILWPENSCLHELIEAQVKRTPDAIAVTCMDEQVTYAALNAQANHLTHWLCLQGIGPEVPVGLLMPRGPNLVTALLAVLKAGGAALPIDLRFPGARQAQLVLQSGTPLVLTTADTLDKAQALEAAILEARDSTAATEVPDSIQPQVKIYEPSWRIASDIASDDAYLDLQQPSVGPTRLAYIMFTSGSTGTPKGVMVEQRGMLNHVLGKIRDLGITTDDTVAQNGPAGFDIVIWQSLASLVVGGRICVFPDQVAHDPQYLVREIDRCAVTVLQIVPSLLRMLLPVFETTSPRLPALRWLVPTGEALPPDLCQRWLALYPAIHILNTYGTTECSDDQCHYVIDEAPNMATSLPIMPIGRPIGNMRTYVLTSMGQPSPIGIPGELYVGGIGVGRGYLDKPDLTADRFLPDPFGAEPGARLYRTGDLARYLLDGTLEYVRRIDDQVKVQGFRIELGEIEAVLQRHPKVDACAVIAHPGPGGNQRLVGYIVPRQEIADSADGAAKAASIAQQAADWQAVYNDHYGRQQISGLDPSLHLATWVSSYTGTSFTEEEVFACLQDTVECILAMRPRHVLELGCGSGLLVRRIAPSCEEYIGTDIAEEGIKLLQQELREKQNHPLSHITLLNREARNLTGLPLAHFDLVIINEVVQYFPNFDYLMDVLDGVIPLVCHGGVIFLGDIRSLPLLELQHTSIELAHATDELTVLQLRQRITRQLNQEEELLVNPSFFTILSHRLPRIQGVTIQYKFGSYDNEFTRFRYNVTLHLDQAQGKLETDYSWQDWGLDGMTSLKDIRTALLSSSSASAPALPLALRGLPNARLAAEAFAQDVLAASDDKTLVATIRTSLSQATIPEGIHPDELRLLGEELGYITDVLWSQDGPNTHFNVVFTARSPAHSEDKSPRVRQVLVPALETREWTRYTNDPLHTRATRRGLPTSLRSFLQERLPGYMVPSTFVMLETLPLTSNGKLDRKKLPIPEVIQPELSNTYEAPSTPSERLLAEIWVEVLEISRVGVHDNFFTLGGHSLLAMQVISRIRTVFQVEVPLRTLFEAPTIRGFVEHLEALLRIRAATYVPPLVPVDRSTIIPLSFAQQRLWFLDQLEPLNPFYNLSTAVRISGHLHLPALIQSLHTLVSRHEALRTRFASRDGSPIQIIDAEPFLPIPLISLEALSTDEQDVTVTTLAKNATQQPFHLAAGGLIRGLIMQLSPEEHVLVLTLHHIITDGWSMGVLVHEVLTLYKALSADEPSPLPALPIQYADYAAWQRTWLQGEVLEEQVAYWRTKLAGVPPILELPTDYPRPHMQSYQGGVHNFTVSVALTASLNAFSRQEGLTLFMTLLAAFQILLARYSGQEDIVVGSPIANRTRSETEQLIGFFVNTLVLRTNISANATFQEITRQVHEVCLGAYAHQDLPFEKLVEELHPARNLSYHPLFQVWLVLQNAPMPTIEMSDLQARSLQLDQQTSKFDMSMSISEDQGVLAVGIEYNTDLFQARTIEHLAQHFQTLLHNLVHHPDQPISTLSLFSEGEQQQILRGWNATATDFATDSPIHQLIEAQVTRTPDAIAVTYDAQQMTFAELNQRANGVAYFLRTQGIKPDTLIGISLERSLELVIGLLGILKAGGAYVPLDPNYPAERLEFMIADAGMEMLLTQELLLGRFASSGVRAISIESIAMLDQLDNPISTILPANLAYVIYTSGSTGQPKGAMNTHRAICNRVLWMQAEYNIVPHDRILQKTPISFDVSVWELFWPLITGATLVMARPEGHKDAAYLRDVIQQAAITTLHFVPSMLHAFLEEDNIEQCQSLQRVFSSGEALTADIQNRFLALFDADLHNLYGPTEAAVDVSYWHCQRNVAQAIIPIGRPIANTQLYILDANLQSVPPRIAGELYIGGTGIGRGYFQDSQKTAAAFIPDPFSIIPGERLYRTGDLARYRWDGAIEFLGRTDHQVKIRGFRIEPGEIEAALTSHPYIQRCLVTALMSPQQTRVLVAYVICEPEQEVGLADLRSWLLASLPDWMIPTVVVPLSTFPLNANGKIDRRALPMPDWQMNSGSNKYAPPRTPIEQVLTSLWAENLGLNKVGINDNYFDLGGHSMSVTRLISQIRQTYQLDLSVRDLFESPTIANLAVTIEAAQMIAAEYGKFDDETDNAQEVIAF